MARLSKLLLVALACFSCLRTGSGDIIPGPVMVFSSGGGSSTLNDGLVAYWKLDEASGTRVDSGSNGQDLTDNNTVGSAAAVINDGAIFNRISNEFLDRADSATLSLGADTSFTISAWVKITADTSAIHGVVSKRASVTGTTAEYQLYYNGLGGFAALVSNGSTISGAATKSIGGGLSTSTFYCAVVVHNAALNTLTVYVDTSAGTPVSWADGTQDGSAAFQIGRLWVGDTSNDLTGVVDEVGFWKRALTTDEITELYNSGAGKTCCPFAAP